ncbi:MAG: HEPN domain-containing protein [Candidatus Hydrogenedentes bacterium]|nr:HEPN domain-containing protein [Candidatus Hydrogenedentota bacterium]
MDEAKCDLVRAWLIKARHDLDTAHQISGLPQGHLDVAIYHCQQAAEKAIKGYLAFQDHPPERIHDLKRLVGLAAGYDSAFADLLNAAVILNPYATAFRYPNEAPLLEPTRIEFTEALEAATRLVQFVLSRLPSAVQPV